MPNYQVFLNNRYRVSRNNLVFNLFHLYVKNESKLTDFVKTDDHILVQYMFCLMNKHVSVKEMATSMITLEIINFEF